MRIPLILSRYIGRQFLLWFLFLLAVFLALILLLDTVELLRRAAGKPEATLGIVLRMGLLKLPEIGQLIFPFVILFGAMYTFWRLTRSQELVVVRAAGVSVWQFLLPVVVVALLIGVARVAVVNPIGAVLLDRFNQLENRYLRGQTTSLDVSQAGLWLRQTSRNGQALIHAQSVVPGSREFRPVIVFLLSADGAYQARIDAEAAILANGHWDIRNAWLNRPQQPPQRLERYRLSTDLTFERIQESFAQPEAVSFWDLPRFIDTLEATGFSALQHRLHYQSLLSQPLLFCAMVLLAAAFSLRQTRRGGTLLMVVGGLTTGLVLFVFTDVVLALGVSSTVPVALAAWAPAGASLMLGIAALLHLEDG